MELCAHQHAWEQGEEERGQELEYLCCYEDGVDDDGQDDDEQDADEQGGDEQDAYDDGLDDVGASEDADASWV